MPRHSSHQWWVRSLLGCGQPARQDYRKQAHESSLHFYATASTVSFLFDQDDPACTRFTPIPVFSLAAGSATPPGQATRQAAAADRSKGNQAYLRERKSVRCCSSSSLDPNRSSGSRTRIRRSMETRDENHWKQRLSEPLVAGRKSRCVRPSAPSD
jgi:hypothetical protein